MLKTLVGGERILGAISTLAEFTHVQCIRLFVFILEMAFQRIVTGETSLAIWTFLWLWGRGFGLVFCIDLVCFQLLRVIVH